MAAAGGQSAPASRRRRPGESQQTSSSPPNDDGGGKRGWGGDRASPPSGCVERRSTLALLLPLLAFVAVLCATASFLLLPLPPIENSSVPRRIGRIATVRGGKKPHAALTPANDVTSAAKTQPHRRVTTTAAAVARPPTRAPTHEFDCARISSSDRRRGGDSMRRQFARDEEDGAVASMSSMSSSMSSNRKRNLTLAVVSVCVPGERFDDEYIDASFTNKRRYCDRWGASCALSRERMSPPGGGGMTMNNNVLTRPHVRRSSTTTSSREYSPKWEKLHRITEAMYTLDVDWLLWIDCDAAFANFEIDWRIHLDEYLDPSSVLIASRDDSGINLGVFLLPNTPYARFFVESLYEERHEVERRGWSHKDQSALKNLLGRSPQLACSIDDGVPQGMINSYLDNPNGHQWTSNDWIAHQVFCELKDCPKRFLSFLQSLDPDP